MTKKRTSSILNRFKNTNIKAFLVFLLFSGGVWMLVQFGRTYTDIIRFDLDYINVPKDRVLIDGTSQFVDAEVTSSGFRLLSLSWLQQSLNVDLALIESSAKTQYYTPEDYTGTFKNQLQLGDGSITFLTDSLGIVFDIKQTKTLPVKLNTEFSFALGYSQVGEVSFKPDSIKVSGTATSLDTLESLQTIPLVSENIKQDIKGQVAIDSTSIRGMTLYENTVEYHVQVSKFTEGKLTVPITLTNVPDGVAISIFPKTLDVIYQATLDDFNTIKPENFKIVQDYNALRKASDFFIPKLTKKPKTVTQFKLVSPKVQYIIKE